MPEGTVIKFIAKDDRIFLRQIFRQLNQATNSLVVSVGDLTRLYGLLSLEPTAALKEEPDCVSVGISCDRLSLLREQTAILLRVAA